MNLRNRLIWIAALTVAFAGVQLVAARRKAEREVVGYVSEKLAPLVSECVRQRPSPSPSAREPLPLRVSLVPEGKLGASIEGVELTASGEVQARELVACIRERAKTLALKLPLPGGPQQLELKLPVESPASDSSP